MTAFTIDAFEFSRLKELREGDFAISDLARLAEESVDRSGVVHWVLQGGVDALGHPQLKLSVTGVMRLMCQRCLTPFAFELAAESILILAKDEEAADAIDALLGDDAVDVIVGSKALNISELIEDEALLTLPLSPKHAVCPDQVAQDTADGAKKASPFAVLKNRNQ